jgi:hypothetical protein
MKNEKSGATMLSLVCHFWLVCQLCETKLQRCGCYTRQSRATTNPGLEDISEFALGG